MAISDDIRSFINEWNDSSSSVLVHTSGSTGTPKPFLAEKKRMEASARMTCDFLGLKKGDSALLCMPLKYIAGKMVVVRSIVRELNIIPVEPCGHPLHDVSCHIHFAAMTPMQVFNTLQDADETKKLMAVDNLIIGGGSVDANLASRLRSFPNKVYSTYGMTETLSHIAMRRINGDEASEWYTPMPGVTVSLSPDNTLVINAPSVNPDLLTTNDIAEINSQGQFRIIGRKDNTINSGGIKIQPEEVETLLKPVFDSQIKAPFAISSLPDDKFGEILVLVTPDNTFDDLLILNTCQSVLPHLWIPKRIIRSEIPYTETNKVARRKLKDLIRTFCH
ncbi:MAG: AMP-binding protein [Bacteroidales bacterium]|nr:AMP-binding protein [Bacteroidales bacterium]